MKALERLLTAQGSGSGNDQKVLRVCFQEGICIYIYRSLEWTWYLRQRRLVTGSTPTSPGLNDMNEGEICGTSKLSLHSHKQLCLEWSECAVSH